jgi:hypothetical protein
MVRSVERGWWRRGYVSVERVGGAREGYLALHETTNGLFVLLYRC